MVDIEANIEVPPSNDTTDERQNLSSKVKKRALRLCAQYARIVIHEPSYAFYSWCTSRTCEVLQAAWGISLSACRLEPSTCALRFHSPKADVDDGGGEGDDVGGIGPLDSRSSVAKRTLSTAVDHEVMATTD